MDEPAYRSALGKVLAAHSESAATRIRGVIEHLPPAAISLAFIVFPEQDGEGAFAIQASLEGPDHYTLQKSISASAVIFNVVHTASGLEPGVPLLDPFSIDFEVNDVLVDCAAQWLQQIWSTLGLTPSIPVTVFADEGYGTITPLVLHD